MPQTFTFYSGFSKRSNSTKRPPSGAFSITYDSILFKDNTSLRNPTIQLNVSLSDNMTVYKYCYHHDTERYYFIHDWHWVRGVWECSLKCDILATFRSEISSYNGFIKRASAYANHYIDDSLTQNLSEVSTRDITPTTTYVGAYSYVIGIKNSVGIEYYSFSSLESFNVLAKQIFGNADTFFPDVNYNEFDPMIYISSITAVPYDIIGNNNIPVDNIPIGPWSFECIATKLSHTYVKEITLTFTVYEHPQASNDTHMYLNSYPYTNIICKLPGFGVFQISPTNLDMTDNYTIKIYADPRNTSAYALIVSPNGKFDKISGNLGGTISGMVSRSKDFLNIIPSSIKDVLNFGGDNFNLVTQKMSDFTAENKYIPTVETDVMSFAVKTGLSYINNQLNVTSFGTTDSQVLIDNLQIIEVYQNVKLPDSNIVGYPYYSSGTPGSGFNQFIAPSISIAGYDGETDMINSYLAGGFYYE